MWMNQMDEIDTYLLSVMLILKDIYCLQIAVLLNYLDGIEASRVITR